MGHDRVKYSHFIPRFYLRNFTFEDTIHPQNNESVLVAFKENFNDWKQKGFGKKSIFTLNGLYDFDITPEQSQTVEKYLAIIETGMGVVVNKLQKHEKLMKENYSFLSMFIVSLMNRTPQNMKQFQKTIQEIHDIFEELDPTQNNEYTKSCFKGFEDLSKIRILKTLEIIKKSQFLQDSFYFLYNNSNIPFITSDNPVVMEAMFKNTIEEILTFPVQKVIPINKKSIILPLTPNICVLYCEYLDRVRIDKQVITILDSNIILNLNMLQFRNCENFVISNVNNSQIDYAGCFEKWSHKDNTGRLIFFTEQNKYMLQAEFIEYHICSSKIKIYDIDEFQKINLEESITSVMTCDKSKYMKVQTIKIVEIQKDYLIIENSIGDSVQ